MREEEKEFHEEEFTREEWVCEECENAVRISILG